MAITAAAIIVDREICFSLRTCHNKSYCKINAKKIKLRRKIKSTKRSAMIVPNDFSKGIFSYELSVVALNTSQDLGIPRLATYAIRTAKIVFTKRGL